MTMRFDEKSIKALRWMIDILDRHSVEYQVSGGLAGKLFGSERPLNDIDIDMSEKRFQDILPEIKQYIIYGPGRYKDAKWDLELVTLDYHGQEIDLGGVDSLIMSNKERTSWDHYPADFSKALKMEAEGIKIKVINPKEFIRYKKELDGEHQLEDLRAAEAYEDQN